MQSDPTTPPKRIWADPPETFDGMDIWRSEPGGKGVPYILASEVAALIAEAEARGRSESADYALALEQELRDRAEQPKPSESGFDCLILDAMAEAMRAMRKFPQPNYVISKIAEEAGEVVKAAIHCAEGRETAENLRSEMKQLIAMIYRLWAEGDQVHGLPSVHGATLAEAAAIRAAKGETT